MKYHTTPKSLNDIRCDMSELHDNLLSGEVEHKLATELANITGKNLKAIQLELAEKIFSASLTLPGLTQPRIAVEPAIIENVITVELQSLVEA